MSYAEDRLLPHYVYVMYDADDWVLYIGRSKNVAQRVAQHVGGNAWWVRDVRHVQAIGPMPFEDAADLEAALIYRLAPVVNYQHNVERIRLAEDEGWNNADLIAASLAAA